MSSQIPASTELERLSAAQLGREISKRRLSPVEVMHYFLSRAERRNPSINAFTYLKPEEAVERAGALEKRIMAGEPVGPFAGVPVALKDFLPSKRGWTSSHGGVRSLIMEDNADSVFCRSAENADAIVIGKTNAPAFGFRGTCDNLLYGPTKNPFNTEYNSGGSSGGTAAAIADGIILMGQGTDGGGSIRIPAAWCNCFGFKASLGLIPQVNRPDAWAASHPYCFDGCLTKTVEDSAIMLNLMKGYDPRDPFSVDYGEHDYSEEMKRPLTGVRIAYTPDFNVFPVDDEIEKIVRTAAFKLAEAGAIVEQVDFNIKRTHTTLAESWCLSISIDTAIEMELWKKTGLDLIGEHAGELPEEFIYWNKRALNAGIMDYREFHDIRTEILDAEQDILDKYDLIISPVTICPPVKNAADRNTLGPVSVNGEKIERVIGFCETFFENYTGHPAASVPAGFTSEGLPVGMQIIAQKNHDGEILSAAHTFEEIQPWDYKKALSRIIV